MVRFRRYHHVSCLFCFLRNGRVAASIRRGTTVEGCKLVPCFAFKRRVPILSRGLLVHGVNVIWNTLATTLWRGTIAICFGQMFLFSRVNIGALDCTTFQSVFTKGHCFLQFQGCVRGVRPFLVRFYFRGGGDCGVARGLWGSGVFILQGSVFCGRVLVCYVLCQLGGRFGAGLYGFWHRGNQGFC